MQTREPYVSSFSNKMYTNIQGIQKSKILVNNIMFVQVLQQVFNQMSLKVNNQKFRNKTIKGITNKIITISLL